MRLAYRTSHQTFRAPTLLRVGATRSKVAPPYRVSVIKVAASAMSSAAIWPPLPKEELAGLESEARKELASLLNLLHSNSNPSKFMVDGLSFYLILITSRMTDPSLV